ncbi:Hypothetical protein D9617_26g078860 [Elsinoe fawcettii]|nr:Hypothetical protein D9617_26g078860 [Elsinoe fawcettii]
MRSVNTLSILSLLGSLAAASPLSGPLTTRTCNFDEANPLVISEDVTRITGDAAPISKRQTSNTRPAALAKGLDEVWKHTVDTRTPDFQFKNYLYDQIIATKGKVNYCVRWDSTKTSTEAQRADTLTALKRSMNKWIDSLAGYDGWPYSDVEVNVVGYAVKNPSLLQGSTAGLDVYTTTDAQGIPQCDEGCGRFFNKNGVYNNCKGGADRHYDVSLWLTDGFNGGAGGDWGQRIGTEYFLGAIKQDSIHILLHEIGHGFALDDFYDWTPSTGPAFIMNAGGSTVITDFDTWMLRDWWTKIIKARYPNLAAGAGAVEEDAAATPSSIATTASYTESAEPTATADPEEPTEPAEPTEPEEPAPAPPVPTATGALPTRGPRPTGTGAGPTGVPRPTGFKWPRPGSGRPRRTRRPRPTGGVGAFATFWD